MVFLLLFLSLFASHTARAEGPAPAYWTYTAASPVTALAAADLNNDGQVEILAGTEGGRVLCLHNDGTLLWEANVDTAPVLALAAVDRQGDGQKRVVVSTGQGLRELDNLGHPLSARALENPPSVLLAAELEGNRREELLGYATGEAVVRLSAQGDAQTVFEAERRRAGQDVSAVRLLPGVGERHARLAVTATAEGSKGALPRHTLSVFAPNGQVDWTYRLDAHPVAVDLVRLSAQGTADHVALAGEDGSVVLLSHDGAFIWAAALGEPCVGLASGRFAPDGQPGLAVALKQQIAMLGEDGTVRWRSPLLGTIHRVLAADLTGDGHDLAVVVSDVPDDAAEPQAQLTVLAGDGQIMAQSRLSVAPADVLASDVNHDGRQELLVGVGDDVQLLAYPGRNIRHRAQWEATLESPVRALAAHPSGLVVAGDNHTLALLAADGTETWRRTLPAEVTGLAQGDVDGDGQLEVAVCYGGSTARSGLGGGGVALLRADDGQQAWDLPMEMPALSVAMADLTGDGRAEVLVGASDQLVRALNADGSARWTRSMGGSVVALAAEALNGDGAIQVVAATDSGALAVLDGNGVLLWQTEIGGAARHVVAAHLGAGNGPAIVALSDRGELRVVDSRGRPLWQREGAAGQALVASDLDGDGLDEIMVGWGDLAAAWRADGTQFWTYGLDGRIADMVVTDSDRDGLNEVILGDERGDLAVLSPLGQELETQNMGAAVTHLVARTGKDGRPALAVSTQRNGLALLLARPDSPPLVGNLYIVSRGGGYVFAATAKDPDGDPVNLTLEVLDPLRNRWVIDERRWVQGQGVQHWIRPAINLWSLGRSGQYRVQVESTSYQYTVGPLPGPAATGLPWLFFLAAVAMLSAAVLGFWRWRRSPGRQSAALLRQFRRDPSGTLAELRLFLVSRPQARANLMALADRARRSSRFSVAALAEGYYLLATQPESALAILRDALSSHPGWRGSSSHLDIVEGSQALLAANSIARVTLLKSVLDRMEKAFQSGDSALRTWLPFLRALGRARAVLRDGERVERGQDQLLYLEEANSILEGALGELVHLPPLPEQGVMAAVARSWLRLVAAAIKDLRGRAALEMTVKTRRIVGGAAVSLVVTVENIGSSPASQVTLRLAPDAAYTVLKEAEPIAFLPSGHTSEVEFTIRTDVNDRFRVELLARYDDHEAAGKTQALGDMVDVLHPSNEFVNIPNPYTPGRPLRPNSPVFFGREDIFRFVADNARGQVQRNVLMLIGQRRTGKTSILLQLARRLGDNYLPVYLDCQSLGITPGMPAFFYDLASSIAESALARGLAVDLPPEAEWRDHPTRTFEHVFLSSVTRALGSERTLLLVLDEFEDLEDRVASGRLDATVFPYLRHLLQHCEGTAFVFVGTHRLEEMTADYWSVFFNTALYRHVDYLGDDAAIRLITEPVQPYHLLYDDLALNRILRLTAGHPYFLQLICYALVNLHNRTRSNYVTVRDTDQAVDEILTLGEAHFGFLWEESTSHERAVLMALTRLLATAVRPVTAVEVAALLAERGLALDPRDVGQALRGLVAREIVREYAGDTARYDFRLGLVGLWIDRRQSFAQVIEEIT